MLNPLIRRGGSSFTVITSLSLMGNLKDSIVLFLCLVRYMYGGKRRRRKKREGKRERERDTLRKFLRKSTE
jgi:uncharacterized protein (DUF2225 family)